MRLKGKITRWNDAKGYGFVEPDTGGARAFVHITSFSRSQRRPTEGDLIRYHLVRDKNGRYNATKITFSGTLKNGFIGYGWNLGSTCTLVFCAFLILAAALGKLPLQVLVIYTAASSITFLAYAVDKSAAKHNRWRTQERTLHLFSLIGGWPGAFYAQKKLRHKSSKPAFKRLFWLTAALNVGATLYLFTESGSQLLQTLPGM